MIISDGDFEAKFKYLDKLWVSPKNSIKRQWYIQKYSFDERIAFIEKWCNDMKR